MRKFLAYANLRGMSNRTPTYLLIEDRLGKSLIRHVSAARKNKRSWNAIALDIHAQTGIAVTSETLRTWFYDHTTKGADTDEQQVVA